MKERKLIIGVEDNGLVSFENLQDFTQLELVGVLHLALATADVLYKTKLMRSVDAAMKELNKREVK